jgi:alkylation response protein AidB-like acyl-CoA dehydrogenase
MRFTFTEEQRRFQASIQTFLEKECTPAHVRALWATETGRSPERWAKLAEIGLLGLLVPERFGGLGMDEIDLVLLLEETGRAALPEPVIETAAVGVPLLAALAAQQERAGSPEVAGGSPDAAGRARELAGGWLARVVSGGAVVTVGHGANPLVTDAHVADLLLLQHGDEVHALSREHATLERQPCADPSRRLFRVTWLPASATRVALGEAGRRLLAAAFDRGALAAAAQLLGIGQTLVNMAVRYACQREQFGKPIGSFQAVKHMLANVAVRLEFARPVVYRAAFSVARDAATRAVDVSHAKVAASEAAVQAAKVALQVHGAVGYTWEMDLHIWMKRAWALEAAWGTGAWHRERVAAAILDNGADSR